MSPIRVVLFDLGGVVVDVDKDRARAVWHQATGRPRDDFDAVFFDSGIKASLDLGELDAEQALARIHAQTGVPGSVSVDAFCAMLSTRQVVSVLARRLSKTYRVGVISNTDPIHAAWIQRHCALDGVVQNWTFSFAHHALKPDPALYHAALAAMGCRPEQSLLVDDRADNLDTATALGMHTALYLDFEGLVWALEQHGVTEHGVTEHGVTEPTDEREP